MRALPEGGQHPRRWGEREERGERGETEGRGEGVRGRHSGRMSAKVGHGPKAFSHKSLSGTRRAHASHEHMAEGWAVA